MASGAVSKSKSHPGLSLMASNRCVVAARQHHSRPNRLLLHLPKIQVYARWLDHASHRDLPAGRCQYKGCSTYSWDNGVLRPFGGDRWGRNHLHSL
jgi:hypothetical protein